MARYTNLRVTKIPVKNPLSHVHQSCHEMSSTWHDASLLSSCSCFSLISPWITSSWLFKCHNKDINMTKKLVLMHSHQWCSGTLPLITPPYMEATSERTQMDKEARSGLGLCGKVEERGQRNSWAIGSRQNNNQFTIQIRLMTTINIFNDYYILYQTFIFWIVFHGLITERLVVAYIVNETSHYINFIEIKKKE